MIFKKIFFLLLLLFTAVSCSTQSERRDEFYSQSKKYFFQKDFDDAIVNIKNALRIDPRFSPALTLLGKIYLEKKEYKKALHSFSESNIIDPASFDNNIGLAESNFYLKDFAESKKYINNVVERDPGHPRMTFFRGFISYVEGEYGAVIEILKKIDKDLYDEKMYILLANSYMKLNQPKQAIHLLLDGKKQIAEGVSLSHLLAKIYEYENDYINAEKEYKLIAKNNDVKYKIVLSEFFLRNNKIDEAINYLNDSLEIDFNIELLKFLTNIYIIENKTQNAEETIIKFVNNKNSNKNIIDILIDFYIHQKKFGDAIILINKMIETTDSVVESKRYHKLLLAVYESMENSKAVAQQMKLIREIDSYDCDALMYFANKSLKKGDINGAILKYRQVMNIDSSMDRSFIALARAYQIQGNISLARNILIECISQNDSIKAHRFVSAIYEQENNIELSYDHIKIAFEKNPKDLSILKDLIRLQLKSGNIAQAEEVLEHCIELEYHRKFCLYALSNIYRAQGKFARAHAVIDQLIKKYPDEYGAHEQKLAIFIAQNDNSSALDFIDQKDHTLAVKKLLEGSLHFFKNEYELSLYSYISSLKIKNSSYVLSKILKILIHEHKYDQGISLVNKYIGEYENNAQILFLLGYLYELTGNYKESISAYNNSLKSQSDFFPAANNIAYLYAEKFPTRSNLEYALNIMSRDDFVITPQSLDTLAWVHAKLGNFDRSIAILKTISAHPNASPLVYYHLGFSYLRSGDKHKAKAWLQKSVDCVDQFEEKTVALELLHSISG